MAQTQTRQQRRAILLDDPNYEGLRTSRRRGALSATLLGILVLEAAAFGLAAGEVISTTTFFIILAGLVIGLVFALGALKISTRGIEELSPTVLDERQIQIRGSVYTSAYRLVSGIFIATVIILLLAQSGLWEAPAVLPWVVAVIALQLVMIIPTLVTARHSTA